MSSWHAGVAGNQVLIPPVVLGVDQDVLRVARHKSSGSDNPFPRCVCKGALVRYLPGRRGNVKVDHSFSLRTCLPSLL